MFLTALLRRNRLPGRQWIGKHRRPRTVSFHAKERMIRRLEVEAENHYWLSMPCLTAEQEYGHAAERRAAAFEAIKAASMSKFPPSRFVVDQLDHLTFKELPRDRQKQENMKHSGNITFDEIVSNARQMWHQSLARELSGTIKEILGTARSVGCSVDGRHPHDIIDDVNGTWNLVRN
ncbi:hypothetical protein GH733_006774 [Mirounga leonina]|nr:hypothetical protein GH733_006774 [Mirounga leonina]